MTKKERNVLKQASEIISSELSKNKEVRIPGFGKFYTTSIIAQSSWNDDGARSIKVNSARFRPWTKLKNAISNRHKAKRAVAAIMAMRQQQARG